MLRLFLELLSMHACMYLEDGVAESQCLSESGQFRNSLLNHMEGGLPVVQ